MDVSSTAAPTPAWRFCVRLAVALCLIVFSVGDAVERSFEGHVALDSALAYAVSTDASAEISRDHSGVHVETQSGDVDTSGQIVGHGCHGCAALLERMSPITAALAGRGSPLAWASVPSTAGREPLVDLPPPRA